MRTTVSTNNASIVTRYTLTYNPLANKLRSLPPIHL